ncbi:MAG: hypothetical protein C5B46_07560 [Proteobacteria bacterium]|nr:MAG: hypothetical protein C5B46_07560 [Pseudomonadota bacterium]
MNATDLAQLIAELLAAIHVLAGYPIPDAAPSVRLAPLSEMQSLVCRGPCQVRGFYTQQHGVVVNEALDLTHDAAARSVLLHELVHYLQQLNKKFDRLPSRCGQWFARESEAYEIQNAYLREQGNATRFDIESIRHLCRDEAPVSAVFGP